MLSLSRPTEAILDLILKSESNRKFTYSCVGATANDQRPIGFDLDENRFIIGHGDKVFEAACIALRRWQQFPPNWARIYPNCAPLAVNQPIIAVIRNLGIWWIVRRLQAIRARFPSRDARRCRAESLTPRPSRNICVRRVQLEVLPAAIVPFTIRPNSQIMRQINLL